jgi:tRNA/rRNA methyltransferase
VSEYDEALTVDCITLPIIMLSHCRIVLVRSEVAGNIGAAARVMRNFGLTDLALVAPVADPLCREARQRSTHGEAILENAQRVETLDEALVGCLACAAASARIDGICRREMVGAPDQIMPKLLELLPSGPIALVFGPEPSGLTTAEVSRCDYLINIPTAEESPALNLSHAVAICIYELRRQWLLANLQPAAEELPAPDEDRERVYQHLRKALEDVHFLWDDRADLLFHGLRQLIGRARPTPNEVRLLHGLARQMEWVVSNDYKATE